MPDEKADFWDAVAYVGGLPDPRAKLVASQATLIGDMREALKSMDEEVAVLHDPARCDRGWTRRLQK